ncbi:DUF2190 family protein [uncultured Desulfosarcina sp.]|uniref:DUF2190 family protein n=1 Tax=uncultured Desulfosarcina sp. TaxID=218289 RepID=UPI0029C706A0|nr:DUF2190 family protein [uncultured Desulfosarcina sp.]
MVERRDFSLEAGADLANHRLIKMSGGKAVYNTATSTDNPIGVSKLNAKNGEDISAHPMNKEGTTEITAAGAIGQGAEVFAAAEGKIQALPASAGDYRRIGLAMSAASGDGSIIEILPYGYTDIVTVS